MEIQVHKYQATGDDFIIIDNRNHQYDKLMGDTELKYKMCHRNFGVGSNGIIEIKDHPKFDYEVVYHSAEGQKCGVCGNGCRMALAHASNHFLSDHQGQKVTFQADDGKHTGIYDVSTQIACISMSDVQQVIKESPNEYFINMATPHFVRFVDDHSDINFTELCKTLIKKKQYLKQNNPNQIIVNFVVQKEDGLYPRTYDPGAKGEILACGTASTAMSICSVVKDGLSNGTICTVPVHWGNDKVEVSFLVANGGTFTDITLKGPAKHVFSCKYKI